MRYRRADVAGGTYFFTVNLADRSADTLVRHIDALRKSMAVVKAAHPFSLVAMVVLPEHLHAIWRLPSGDADYPTRWALLKAGFSRQVEKGERINSSRAGKRERELWQRRYREHQIRDKNDLARHVDYIHFNPVKHGWAARPVDWPHSTVHGSIERGMMSRDWGGNGAADGDYGER